MKLFDFLKTQTTQASPNNPHLVVNKIIAMVYADYPEKPYISPDRKIEWIEMAKQFPKTTPVQKHMMQRFANGLLPGHVYMLYWLKKNTNKKVPSYFEYKYGIDFEKEKLFLYKEGYLDSMNKPTAKGEKVIEIHSKVIENHSPKRDLSTDGISKQILASKDNIIRNGFKEYEFIANRDCCQICAALNGKHFPVAKLKIGVNAPPMHDGCKCSIAAYEDDKEYGAWLNCLDKGGTTADWEKAKKKKK